MVGPSLIGAGVFFCFLRVFFCTCPHCCRQRCGCQFPCCFQHGAEEPPGVGGAESRRDDVVGIAVQPLQQHGQQQSSSAATPVPGASTQPPLPPSTENESTSRHTSSRGNPSLSSAGGGRPRTSAASTIAAAIDPPDYYADVPKLPTISSVRGSRTDVIREEDDLFVDVDETQFQQQQQHQQQTDEVLLSAKALNSSGLT
ncbi:unnamed protein product [Notodromas monacha]|uniref:Secreted protein n=1 Tax=Notodromas monacha TaxID=399045 RepID=A0A7R9GK22_9CRUS|nr:unnamed protein product [Notodromas monacha]CAG0924281.1 unnamed protein product [Notodromas monacha]